MHLNFHFPTANICHDKKYRIFKEGKKQKFLICHIKAYYLQLYAVCGCNFTSVYNPPSCCCFTSETYGDSNFRSFHRTESSTTGGWSRWNILVCFYYISLCPLRSPVLDLKDAFFFLNFVYTSERAVRVQSSLQAKRMSENLNVIIRAIN